jgi:hypothetical protein
VLEAAAVVAGFDDVAVMGQPVEQCSGHLGVAEEVETVAKLQKLAPSRSPDYEIPPELRATESNIRVPCRPAERLLPPHDPDLPESRARR